MGNMAEDSTSKEVDLRLVAEIVGGYVAHNSVSVDHLSGLISEVHRSLGSLGREAPVQEALVPAVPVKRSVQRDYVVCLDCEAPRAQTEPARDDLAGGGGGTRAEAAGTQAASIGCGVAEVQRSGRGVTGQVSSA
jgi:hypothetical protein